MGISREILVTGLQILGNFPCGNGELVLHHIHRLMLDNLQNFFPFSLREEKKEALQEDDVEEEKWNNEPAEDPAGFLDCCCC